MATTTPIELGGATLERFADYLSQVVQVQEYVSGLRDALGAQGVPPEARYKLVLTGITLAPNPPLYYEPPTTPDAPSAPATTDPNPTAMAAPSTPTVVSFGDPPGTTSTGTSIDIVGGLADTEPGAPVPD